MIRMFKIFLLLIVSLLPYLTPVKAMTGCGYDCPDKTIEMEGYNNWHLPFAKTLAIDGSGDFSYFPDNYYTLILDPCAYYSVIFVSSLLSIPDDKKTGYPLSQAAEITFNFYGESEIKMTGYWMTLDMTMRDVRDWSDEEYDEYQW